MEKGGGKAGLIDKCTSIDNDICHNKYLYFVKMDKNRPYY